MQPQSLFFTLYGDYIWHHGGTIRATSLITMMSQFGLTEPAIRAGLFRLTQSGLVSSTKIGKYSRYTLSSVGVRHLEDGMRRVYRPTAQKWDGLWRLFVYAVAEGRRDRRDQLRHELQWHGMASLAQSTWISPNPIESVLSDIITEYLSEDTAEIFISRWEGDPLVLVNRCWDLSRVADEYRAFVEHWAPLVHKDPGSDAEAFVDRVELVHAYRKFLNIDPNLPGDLLPNEWIGFTARRLFQDLHQQWTPAADRYFASVYEP